MSCSTKGIQISTKGRFSNKLFYESELVSKFTNDDHKVEFPIIFHGVEGIEEKYSYSPSTSNYEEIRVVLKYVYDLIDNKTEFGEVSAKDIGIVTPFTLQSKRIKKILKKKDDEEKQKLKDAQEIQILQKDDHNADSKNNDVNTINIRNDCENEDSKDIDISAENKKDEPKDNIEAVEMSVETDDAKIKLRQKNEKDTEVKTDDDEENEIKYRNLKDINVGTVELFQGQERKIMIMTAVRSKTFLHDGKEHIGFLSNPKRFNVAMSRAQDALIVIGNPGILQKNDMWHYLLKYCIDNESYRGFKFELKTSCNEQLDISETESIATSASLFKQQPFKLFELDDLDSVSDIWRTVKVFVEPEKDERENNDHLRLPKRLGSLRLSGFS